MTANSTKSCENHNYLHPSEVGCDCTGPRPELDMFCRHDCQLPVAGTCDVQLLTCLVGDHGDPDLQSALKSVKSTGRPVPLVVFGHMHHILKGGAALRQMACADDDGTVYLNCAVVPRWANERSPGGSETRKLHQFTTVELHEGRLQEACQVWVAVTGTKCSIVESTVIIQTVKDSNGNDMLTALP